METNKYICDACGKSHYRRPGNIYKLVYKKRTRHFCCYNCYYKLKELIDAEAFDAADRIFAEVDKQIVETMSQISQEEL